MWIEALYSCRRSSNNVSRRNRKKGSTEFENVNVISRKVLYRESML